MRSRSWIMSISTVVLLNAVALAQETPLPAPRADPMQPDVTYGRVKEFTPGQKIVIDVDNAPDKNFELTEKNVSFKLEKGLKVGDTIKVTERDAAGGKKTIEIVKHTGGGVKHGDSDRKK
jgi:hypothetical protein